MLMTIAKKTSRTQGNAAFQSGIPLSGATGAHTTIFHSLGGVSFRDDAEYVEYVQRIHSLRTKYGFMPRSD